MNIIGLTGKAGVGKDTVADALVELYGFTKYGFADPLYKEVAYSYGVAEFLFTNRETKELEFAALALENCTELNFRHAAYQYCENIGEGPLWRIQEKPRSPRWLLQVWGTQYRRAQNPDYWLDKADEFLDRYTGSHEILDASQRDERLACMVHEGRVYQDSPGVVITNVRFPNEREWLKGLNGELWHVQRDYTSAVRDTALHISEAPLAILTGDKLFLNCGTKEQVGTGVVLMMQGNHIVNTKGE